MAMDAKDRLLMMLSGDPAFARYVATRTATVASGCVVWTGDTAHGYGVVNFQKKRRLAHREIADRCGLAVNGKTLCHKCDNPPCVWLDHLFVGTEEANIRDASSKDRTARKLNNARAREIRQRYGSGTESYGTLAAEFGVSKGMIRDVVKMRRWAWAA